MMLPQISKAKSTGNLLNRFKQEQTKLEEQLVIEFIDRTLNITIPSDELHLHLKDGIVLCNLVNSIRPNTIRVRGQNKEFPVVQMDTISRFLQGVAQLGIPDIKLFEPADLYSARNMSAVIHTILTLAEFSNSQQSPLHGKKERVPGLSFLPQEGSQGYKHVRDIFPEQRQTKKSPPPPPPQLITKHEVSARPPKSPLRSCTSTSLRPNNKSSQRQVSEPGKIADLESYGIEPSTSTCSSLSSCSAKTPVSPQTPPLNEKHFLRRKHSMAIDDRTNEYITDTKKYASLQDAFMDTRKITLKNDYGEFITHYQLGNCIGKGQFGSVYRALDLSTGETVAVKRIKLEDENIYHELMKEVNMLKTLSHANVVKYVGFIPSERYFDVVLEYAENGSLMSTLKAFGAFPEKLVASFCIKILHGLQYLHDNQVVHCDLKAANILTTKTGDVKLTDFGVSLNLKLKPADSDTIAGTPNWMAPEVIELEGANTKSDIWSLGCTLIELITGKPPYSQLLAMSAMFHIVEDEYPPLPQNISSEMRDFLLCCFQKNPKKRPSSQQLQSHVWIRQHQQQKGSSSKKLSSDTKYQASRKSYQGLQTKYYSLNANSTLDENHNHQFIQTSFGKDVECKVCNEALSSKSLFCETCSLVCHRECKKMALSCPPRLHDQQPSYEWIFSAKVYNRSYKERQGQRGQVPVEFLRKSLQEHPQADSIRKYSKALGLTEQEQLALCENPALLEHTMTMERLQLATPVASNEPFSKTKKKKELEESCKLM
ncbi:kinase-like domain-containing protein [Choanephora cucurbitarum]|nr:kinase-like domain-containing protein [Choanephora cucurbitarum]